jgi:sugar lactone lactonase YvrE
MVLALSLTFWIGAAGAASGGTTVASGFNGPMGVLVAPDGSVWVIDSGVGGDKTMPGKDPETGEDITVKLGDTARIVQITPDDQQIVAATLPSMQMGQETSGGSRLALLNGVLYATSGGWQEAAGPDRLPNQAAVVKVENGKAIEVANTWDLESSQNPDGTLIDTHPYGLTAGPDGQLWVADAGGNDLLVVDPATGQVRVVAVFQGLSSPIPNPNRGGANEADPVPTRLTFDTDGNMYVSFLSGAPFVPGSAKVVKVTPDGQVSDYATGLTTLTDLRTGPDGNLYAVQFAEFTEQGPTPNSGRIIRVKAGDASEVVAGGLSFPTSIDFNDNGDAYVTVNGVGAPGSGEVLMFPALTTEPGSPLTKIAPPALPETGGEYPSSYLIIGTLLVSGLALIVVGLFLKYKTV